MTPEGKVAINNILEPYEARVDTEIEPGQDIRFIKITTEGPSENPLNVLDSERFMVHAEHRIRTDQAWQLGRPLLRLMTMSYHSTNETNVLLLEDVNAAHRRNNIAQHGRGAYY
jgi:hypothetical protein